MPPFGTGNTGQIAKTVYYICKIVIRVCHILEQEDIERNADCRKAEK